MSQDIGPGGRAAAAAASGRFGLGVHMHLDSCQTPALISAHGAPISVYHDIDTDTCADFNDT